MVKIARYSKEDVKKALLANCSVITAVRLPMLRRSRFTVPLPIRCAMKL